MKRKNKIFFAVLLFCALLFLFVACQKSGPSESIEKAPLTAACTARHSKTTDNKRIATEYCDCNEMGVILENEGKAGECSSHVLGRIPQETYAAFDALGASYADLHKKVEPEKTGYKKFVLADPDNSEINALYEAFTAQIKNVYDHSPFFTAYRTAFPKTGGALAGINRKYLLTCGDKYSHSEVLRIAARLFGYANTDTFINYASVLSTAYAAKDTDVASDVRLSLNGAVYTENKAYVFPYIVSCDRTSVFPVCLILDPDGTVAVWIGDEESAQQAVDLAGSLTENKTIELYGRCRLFETVSGFYRFSFAEGAHDVPGTYAKIALSTTDGLKKDLTVYLLSEYAPETVANFIKYAESGFYSGTAVHRIIPGIGIQGGSDVQTGGKKNNGYSAKPNSEKPIKGEFVSNGFLQNVIGHCAGVISMARTDKHDSATSGFFICSADNNAWDGSYAAFGFMPYQEDIDFVDTIVKKTTTQDVTTGGITICYPASRLIDIEEVTIYTVE